MIGRPAKKIVSIRGAVLAVLPQLIREWLPGGEQRNNIYVARNPLRDDRHLGSFQIDTETGRWRDHAVAHGGTDAISLYAYLFTANDRQAAFAALTRDLAVRAAVLAGATASPAKSAKTATPAKRQELVQKIYSNAVSLQGTPAAAYLNYRGLQQTNAWDDLRAAILRYPYRGWHPALVAPMRSLDGSIVGLHRTYLTPNGRKLDVTPPRLTLGRVRGAAIQLEYPSDKLIICEGLEDGLTLHQELDGHPVWVAGGASFMRTMSIPETVRLLIIAADNDAAGEHAAIRAADAHIRNQREVRIMRPDPRFKDFNDEFQGKPRD